MQDSVSRRSPTSQWYWLTAGPTCGGNRGAGLSPGGPWGTGNKAALVQPVATSTDWALDPTGPAVAVNLLKTPMTNTPEIAA